MLTGMNQSPKEQNERGANSSLEESVKIPRHAPLTRTSRRRRPLDSLENSIWLVGTVSASVLLSVFSAEGSVSALTP